MNQVNVLYGLNNKKMIEKRNQIIKSTGVDDFNLSIFDLDETDLSEALSTAYSMPFLSEERVVVIKNASFLSNQRSRGDDKEKKKIDYSSLIDYINNPCRTTILIIECTTDSLDNKKDIVKIIKEKRMDFYINPSSKEEIVGALNDAISKNNINISMSAKDELLKRLLDDPINYQNELEKLILYSLNNKNIDLIDIKVLITETISTSYFDLIGAIASKDRGKALLSYSNLIEEGNEPLAILNFIVRRFSQLLYVKEMLNKKLSNDDISEYLKVSKNQVYYLVRDAKSLDYKVLSRILNELKDLDSATKVDFKYGDDTTIGFELFLTKI